MHGPSAPPPRELISIQYLRGVAALMVVVYHIMCNSSLYDMHVLGRGAMFLNSGVDIFFVISGFIMWHTTRGRVVTPTRFLADRAIRIVPLYWAVTLGLLVIALVAPTFLRSAVFNVEHGLKSLFFIPMHHPKFPTEFWPFLIPGWTLNYEMFFYVVFAVSLTLPRRLALPFIGATFAGLSLLALIFPKASLVGFYGDLVIWEFLGGALLSEAARRNFRLPKPVCIGLIVGGFVILSLPAPFSIDRLWKWGFPAMAIVGGAVLYELKGGAHRIPTLKWIGDISYSLYLTHALVIAAGAKAVSKLDIVRPALPIALAASVVIVAGALVAAFLAYRLIEKPSSRLLKGALGLAPARVRAPVAA